VRPRWCVSFGQKWKTGTGRQCFTDIGLSSTTVTIGMQSYRIRWENSKIRAFKPFKVIQGYQGQYQSKARMRLPIRLIVSGILSRTVSELSQLIVQILDTLRFWAPIEGLVRCLYWVHWKTLSGLPISVNWTVSLGVTAEALRAKIDRKSAISLQRGHFDPKFHVKGVTPTNHFCTDS